MQNLISRSCLCGCGKSFRVFSTNLVNHFFNQAHAKLCLKRGGEIALLAESALQATIRIQHSTRRTVSKRERLYRKTFYEPPGEDDIE